MNIKDLFGYSEDKNTSCICVSGEDSEKFLQGQFSNDVTLLVNTNFQYSSYSTNQGKVISIFRIFKYQDSYILLVNKDIAKYFIDRLSMYVLMSKVEIKEINSCQVFGVCGLLADDLISKYNIKKNEIFENNSVLILNNTNKYMSAVTLIGINNVAIDITDILSTSESSSYNINELMDNLSLIPRITMETKEKYIPQVLNLESLDGINYKKGCYTGQEIVARTHYLGKVKKKILLLSELELSAKVGDKLHNKDGEIIGDIFGTIQKIENDLICLSVIKIEAMEEDIFLGNKKIKIFQ